MNSTTPDITIRRASRRDEADLLRLASLDSARPLSGDVLVGEADGEIWAAIDLASGRVIADPFRPTSELVALLELRFARVRGERRHARRRLGRVRLGHVAEPARI